MFMLILTQHFQRNIGDTRCYLIKGLFAETSALLAEVKIFCHYMECFIPGDVPLNRVSFKIMRQGVLC